MAAFLFISFYVAMVLAGYLVELIFWILNISPTLRNAKVLEPNVTFNYTTILNIIFLLISTALVWRFLRTGGPKMLKIMNSTMSSRFDSSDESAHANHHYY